MNADIDLFFKQHRPGLDEIHSIHIPIKNVTPLEWISAQPIYPKFFWANRDHSEVVASIGSLLTLKPSPTCTSKNVFKKMRSIAARNHEVFFCGGTSFNPKKQLPLHWKPLGKFFFFLPRFTLKKTPEGQTLTIFLKADEVNPIFEHKLKEELKNMFSSTRTKPSTGPSLASVLSTQTHQDQPQKEEWLKHVDTILRSIRQKLYEKVVLARESRFQLGERLAPAQLLNILSTPSNTFDFYLQTQPDTAFLGRSPELLFKRTQDELYSEAVAGSLPSKSGSDVDTSQAKTFLHDDKSKHEHNYVIEFLSKQFKSLCSSSTNPTEVTTLKQPGLLHLFSSLKGKLKPNIHDEDILRALHPTPAVGGYPKANIIKKLAKLERFSRGWYAAPIGIISHEKTEMAVGLRSLLQHKKSLFLYAGAGIIKESVAQSEWQELEQKVSHFKQGIHG